jgi:hypothetical protein
MNREGLECVQPGIALYPAMVTELSPFEGNNSFSHRYDHICSSMRCDSNAVCGSGCCCQEQVYLLLEQLQPLWYMLKRQQDLQLLPHKCTLLNQQVQALIHTTPLHIYCCVFNCCVPLQTALLLLPASTQQATSPLAVTSVQPYALLHQELTSCQHGLCMEAATCGTQRAAQVRDMMWLS